MTPNNVKKMQLWAWVGEDEHGSGKVGLKQGVTNAGIVPLVACEEFKVDVDEVIRQLQHQANVYGKTIRLCRFVLVEEVITLEPDITKSPYYRAGGGPAKDYQ